LKFFNTIFETPKQQCFNKINQSNLKWKKKLSSPNFCIIWKKSDRFIFSLQYGKKFTKRKGKEFKEEKKYSWKYFKRKKIQRKKFVAGVLAIALLYVIHGVFNPTQAFLHMTKKLL